MRKLVLMAMLTSFSALLLAGCSETDEVDKTVPQATWVKRQARNGKISGDDGFSVLGRKKDDSGGGAIGVNSYLWRATLDTLSFMPLVSADPFGGVIITDWYEDPKTPGERFKVNALILDKSLRADGVKLTIFKQSMSHGMWRDQKVDAALQKTLEDTILTRARQLRMGRI